MPRLGFPKSRKGCLRCKQRRVKPRDVRPGPVSASGLSGSRGTSRSSRSDAGSLPASGDSKDNNNNNNHPFPYLASLVKAPKTQGSETWTSDLELMHHYTAITYKSLPRADKITDIWQLELPRLAVTHEFLMHQLLAISAAHMARLSPQEASPASAYYSMRATQHQNQAIQQLQSTLPAITDASCPAVFLAASLLAIGEFAAMSSPSPSPSPSSPQELPPPQSSSRPGIDDLLRVFLLVRGMSDILVNHSATIARSCIGSLLQLGQYDSRSALLDGLADQLGRIAAAATTGMDDDDNDNDAGLAVTAAAAAAAALRDGAESLVRCIRMAVETSDQPELRVTMSWPADLTDGFTGLLRGRDGDALKVLDCYCCMLETLGGRHWYLEGWGQSVREDIRKAWAWQGS
ncbi:hypothetical protein ACO1O0_003833 [Amphichorda felina]